MEYSFSYASNKKRTFMALRACIMIVILVQFLSMIENTILFWVLNFALLFAILQFNGYLLQKTQYDTKEGKCRISKNEVVLNTDTVRKMKITDITEVEYQESAFYNRVLNVCYDKILIRHNGIDTLILAGSDEPLSSKQNRELYQFFQWFVQNLDSLHVNSADEDRYIAGK